MTEINVLVVDGQRTFADALAARLAVEPGLRLVAAAESPAAARRLLIGRPVDVVLLDSELPEGLPFAAELASPPDIPPEPVRVIALGPVPEDMRIVEALRCGVTGWVAKEDSIERLLNVIRGVMRGETLLPPEAVGPVLRLLLREHAEMQVPSKHPLASLTSRELEVLTSLSEGMSRREIAERMHLSAHTIRSHMQNLMAKLGVHSSLEAVALARQARPDDARPAGHVSLSL